VVFFRPVLVKGRGMQREW